MSKAKSNKKLTFKKSMVRNPELSKPKTVVILEPEIPGPSISGTLSKTTTQEILTSDELSVKESSKSKLASPELNSALRIARAMDSVENIKPRKVKSVSDLDRKKRLAVDERAAKQVNFPYNQHIYKDLIPLCVKTQPPTLPSISREVLTHKDKEPVLSDFFTPKALPEYSFQVPVQNTNKMFDRQFDGLKLYRTIKNWN